MFKRYVVAVVSGVGAVLSHPPSDKKVFKKTLLYVSRTCIMYMVLMKRDSNIDLLWI